MSERIHGMAQLLPEKTSFEDYSLEELQHLTKRFPYFAPAQFLLLQKLRETGSPGYDVQQQKAALYFHNPLLFDYFISADKFLMSDDYLLPAKASGTDMHLLAGEDLSLAEPIKEKEHLSTDDPDIPVKEMKVESGEAVAGIQTGEQLKDDLPPPPHFISTVEESLETEPDKVNDAGNNREAEPPVLPVAPFQEKAEVDVNEQTKLVAEKTENEPQKKDIIVAPASALVPIEETSLVRADSTKETKPATVIKAGEPLLFEPYHTVDYFASQGIKVAADGLPKDKLSHQLRSFTEWLKVMKRLPAAGLEATPQSSAEKTVENLASHSVEGGDVVTEAMAEVWARQGNRQKAIEIYNKLSLQNPSKKAYFAAKIEKLSGT